MKLQMQTMTPDERKYTYQQSQQISMQTGLIGYLRADFGKDGEGFYSIWNDFRPDLKTEDFQAEMDAVIHDLREPGELLHSRKDMTSVLHSAEPGCAFQNDRNEYGVRVNTDCYACLLRLTPRENDYNLYCYCYRRDWLDQHLKQAAKGIRFIDPGYEELFRIPDGDMIRITKRDGSHMDKVCRYIDEYHLEVGSDLYHICELAEAMERCGNTVIPLRSSLPERCYSVLPRSNEIIIVVKGESGYCQTDEHGHDRAEAQAIVEERNRAGGVTKAQEAAMLAGSMFSWRCPAADPKNYDEQGRPNKPRNIDRGDAR